MQTLNKRIMPILMRLVGTKIARNASAYAISINIRPPAQHATHLIRPAAIMWYAASSKTRAPYI